MYGTDECNYIFINDKGMVEIRNLKKPKSKIEFENMKFGTMPKEI